MAKSSLQWFCALLGLSCLGPATLVTVKSLHRYPVKSCLGEELERAEIVSEGILGDRSFIAARQVH